MLTKLFFSSLPARRNLFRSYSSVLAEINNVAHSNAPLQNLFLRFVTTRFNISSADAAQMMKRKPSLGRLQTLDKIEEFVSVLNRFAFNEDQIAYIIRSQPSLLGVSAERVLEPKLQLLKDFGLGGEHLSRIVTKLPRFLAAKLEILRSNLELLKTVFPTDDLLIRAIRNSPQIHVKSLQETFRTSIGFWEDFGFRGTELTFFLLINPLVLTCTSLSPEQLDLIRRIGIDKERKMYKYFVSIVGMRRIEVLEARIHNLQLCGLSPEEALQVVRTHPSVILKSEENVKKKMDFVLNHMRVSVDFMVKHPRMFTMSLDKVLNPRFLVLQIMTEEGEVDPRRLFRMLVMTEAQFVSQIRGHPESAALQTVYKNAIANVSREVC